jgi:hypothetical protein
MFADDWDKLNPDERLAARMRVAERADRLRRAGGEAGVSD